MISAKKRQDAIAGLKEIQKDSEADPNDSVENANEILFRLLKDQGAADVVKAYQKMLSVIFS